MNLEGGVGTEGRRDSKQWEREEMNRSRINKADSEVCMGGVQPGSYGGENRNDGETRRGRHHTDVTRRQKWQNIPRLVFL